MKSKKALVMAMVAVFAIGFLACSDDDNPTCQSAVSHFYDQSCVLTVGGDAITEYEAIDGCLDWQSDANRYGCSGEFQRLLDCFDSIRYQDCYDCDYELESFSYCMD